MADPFQQLEGPERITRPPSRLDRLRNRGLQTTTWLFAWLVLALLAYILWEITATAAPAMKTFGLEFLTSKDWDVVKGSFGILPQIWGTLYSSLLALLIAGFFGVTIAIFLTQDFLPAALATLLRNVVELLAAIPSVVYGLWGIYVVIPNLRPAAEWLHEHFQWIPLFSTSLSGPGMAPAALVLAIMVLPTVTAISQDGLRAVPHKMKEAVFGMGATRWEAILRVILPAASASIFGALVLGLGRALGETMALAMLVGNANQISVSLFSPANTLAALLALNFPESSGLETEALMFAAVVLLAITLAVNILGAAIITRASRQMAGAT
jgi:phosphate transport system permease protein